jgi:hypothetical protein
VNSSVMYLIYCKNVCKCHNLLPHSTIGRKKLHWIQVTHTIVEIITCYIPTLCTIKFKLSMAAQIPCLFLFFNLFISYNLCLPWSQYLYHTGLLLFC